MDIEVDTLEALGIVVGVTLIVVGLVVLADVQSALATGVGVAIGQVLGAIGSICLGAGLALLVRRG